MDTNYIATIEIPKGSDRRIHMRHDKSGFVDLGPLRDKILVNEGIMPVHYGYINNTLNIIDEDDVDTIIFSKNQYIAGDVVNIKIWGMFVREDGDNKVISYDDTIEDFDFNELTKEEQELVEAFICYSSPLVLIESASHTLRYLEDSQVL